MSARSYLVLAFAVVAAAAVAVPARAAVPTPVSDSPVVETARPVVLAERSLKRRVPVFRAQAAYFRPIIRRHIIFLGVGF
jgi:hypothetical protein